jgi:hypothetical protein
MTAYVNIFVLFVFLFNFFFHVSFALHNLFLMKYDRRKRSS